VKKTIERIDSARWLLAALAFLLTMLLLNACASPLPTRRDAVEVAPLPVWVIRNLEKTTQ
jgi:hypothetical protein